MFEIAVNRPNSLSIIFHVTKDIGKHNRFLFPWVLVETNDMSD